MIQEKRTLKKKVENFLFDWHQFPIDYWWRKKYHVPFGSSQHREMNFIDMFIEYQEELSIAKAMEKRDDWEEDVEDEVLGLKTTNEKVVKVTKEEIDDDYEKLDLEQFDKI